MRIFLAAVLLLVVSACANQESEYVQRNPTPCPGTGSFVYPCT